MAIGGKTLTVYLAADVSKLKNGLNSADRSLSGFAHNLNSMVGPAMIGAAAAAGTFAVAMAVDGVQAAIQEEAELSKLSTTLDNLGFADATDEVNTFIDDLQYTAAVSDSTLRPAFSRLLTATNDVTQSQKLLQLALDVSAGTGKSLETVTNALGKAYDGNLGALGKLGAGIDASTIKSKDLEGAISQLSTTFAGQSTAAANTLEGQIKVLGIAFDELKESFGTGFLQGIGDATGGIRDVYTVMRDAQPMAEDLGSKVGALGVTMVDAALNAWKMQDAFHNWEKSGGILGKAIGFVEEHVVQAINPFNYLSKAMSALAGNTDVTTQSIINNGNSLILWGQIAQQADKYVRGGYSGIPASTMFFDIDTWREKQLALIKPIKDTSAASGGLSKAVKEMDPALRKQIDLVKSLTSQLKDAEKALQAARDKMNGWIDDMAGRITSGIDLTGVLGMAFDEAGKETGVSLLDAFQKQIDQANWFGDVLKYVRQQGGEELADAISQMGPEAGGKLAQELIDKGLVPTFQSKLKDVQEAARTTAAVMTPEWAIAGVRDAVTYLTNTQNTLAAATSQLEEMGAAMGKTIGEAAAEEIRKAIEDARGAMGSATGTMGGGANGVPMTTATAVAAPIIAGNPMLNGTLIMQAIQTAIANADQRLGRTGQALNQ